MRAEQKAKEIKTLFSGSYLDRIETSDILVYAVSNPSARMRREVRSLFYDVLHSAYFFLHLIEQLKPESGKLMLCEKGAETPSIDSASFTSFYPGFSFSYSWLLLCITKKPKYG